MTDIDSTLKESRVFPPPPEFQRKAHIKSLDEYRALYKRSVEDPEGFWGEQAATLVLPYVTAILGTVVVMVAVGSQAHGRRVGVIQASLMALPWVPRYVWTNVHTTVIFWTPIGLLLLARAWQEKAIALSGGVQPAVNGLWWLVIAGAALVIHTRTVLAPFLAIHGDLPGTLAVLEAWRLSGRHFAVCLSTLVVAGGPVALPFLGLSLALIMTLPAAALVVFFAVLGDLVWVAIQATRPILIPALYLLYGELWEEELARRRSHGEPPVPIVARILLALTRPLPHPRRPSSSVAGEDVIAAETADGAFSEEG